MKRFPIAAAFCLLAAPAFAFHCPADMKDIDAALEAGTAISEAELSEVKTLRADGEALHKAGDHQGAVDTLAKAKAILGLN
ncbi:hypothetical protein PEL8287_01933 [Roseovarius litorisediminis]|uniref:Uncharacterized protein n=1 Tax=Roseovarius litorisediminis TaxID=1312363 RepID=A0A1Y5SHK2_9RHOB|nr:hypothetical protein [Roseovarius litorisediminis]SLN39298.1 hypothetical protein PEL8287_01933 [Roseovarius litorisediminis]